jgi:charged multivesicular body protein 6
MGARLSRLFGAGKPAGKAGGTISDHDRAVLDLKVARDRLKKYQRKLDGDAATLVKQAQVLVLEGRRDRALMLLKIKKYKLQQSDKADAQLFTVTELIDSVEWEGQQSQVLAALAEGTKALNALHASMPIEDVEQLMADTQEALDYEAEISSVIAGSWTPESESSLMEEFAALEKELAAESAEEKAETKAEAAAAVEEVKAAAAVESTETADGDGETAAAVEEAEESEQAAAEKAEAEAEAEVADDVCEAEAPAAAAAADSSSTGDDVLSQLPEAPTGAVTLPAREAPQEDKKPTRVAVAS